MPIVVSDRAPLSTMFDSTMALEPAAQHLPAKPDPEAYELLAAAPHRGPKRRSWPTVTLAILLVVAIGAGGWLGWTLHDRSKQLDVANSHLVSTTATLETTSRNLTAANSTIQSDKSQISSLDSENTTLQSQVSNAQTQLQGVQSTVQVQSQEIANLRTCLNGVITAANFAAQGDYIDASNAISAVQVVCNTAQNSL